MLCKRFAAAQWFLDHEHVHNLLSTALSVVVSKTMFKLLCHIMDSLTHRKILHAFVCSKKTLYVANCPQHFVIRIQLLLAHCIRSVWTCCKVTSNTSRCMYFSIFIQVVEPASEWCTCGRYQDMPTIDECICCQSHDIKVKLNDRGEQYQCITQHPGVTELMAKAPLEVAWNNYLCYHREFNVLIYICI